MKVGGPSNTQQARSTDSKLSTQEAQTQMTNLLKRDVEGRKEGLGQAWTKTYQSRMEKDIAAFLKDNPNPTQGEIDAFFKKNTNKQAASAMIDKMQSDNFFKKMQQRTKELLADRWE